MSFTMSDTNRNPIFVVFIIFFYTVQMEWDVREYVAHMTRLVFVSREINRNAQIISNNKPYDV